MILRRSFLGVAGLSLASAQLVPAVPVAKEENQDRPPNIIILYTDQQRYDMIAALGNNLIKTPNLDRLCREGVACTEAFATAPVCAPSRTSLFSGQYTTSHRTYSNHHSGPRPNTNLALLLKQRGYKTGLFGKNHTFLAKGKDIDVMSGEVAPGLDAGNPEAWFKAAGITINPPEKKPEVRQKGGADQPKISKRLTKSNKPANENPMHQVTDKALSFIGSCQESQQPFFAWVSWLYPHTPYEASEPFYSIYASCNLPPVSLEPEGLEKANKPFRQIFHQENNNRLLPFDANLTDRMRKTYMGAISEIDYEIGRILDYLDSRNMNENTILVFTADHGDYQGDHGLYTKSPALYDCLIRVPLVFRWTKHWKDNVKSSELISQVDLMPTLLRAAGVKVPDQCQGIELNSFLADGAAPKPIRQAVFAEYGVPGAQPFNRERLEKAYPDYQTKPIDVNGNRVPWEGNPVSLAGRFRMIRTHQWKLIHEPGGTSELYNLASDPNELKNLFGVPEYKGIQTELLEQLITWQKSLPGIEADQAKAPEATGDND